MIVLSMSVKEIYDCIVADAHKIQVRIDKMLPKAVREFKKKRTFPVWYIDEYTIPSTNNKHIIFFYAGKESEVERPHYQSFCVVFDDNQRYLIRALSMGYKETIDSEMVMLPQIHSYTSHFLQRYNERYLHNEKLSANEIAGLFFIKNPRPFPIKLNDEINCNFKKYGEFNNLGVRVNGGFCFARTGFQRIKTDIEAKTADGMLMIYTTFVNDLDMSDEQRNAIDKECLDTLKRCEEQF